MQRTDVLERFAGVGSGSRCRGGGSRRGRTRGRHRSRERGCERAAAREGQRRRRRLRAERRHLGRLGHQTGERAGHRRRRRRRVPLVHASSRMVRTEGSRHRARAGRQERRDDRLAAGDGRAFPEGSRAAVRVHRTAGHPPCRWQGRRDGARARRDGRKSRRGHAHRHLGNEAGRRRRRTRHRRGGGSEDCCPRNSSC